MPGANSYREYFTPGTFCLEETGDIAAELLEFERKHSEQENHDVDSPHLLKMGVMQVCSTFAGERLHLCKWDGKPNYGRHKEPPKIKTLCGKWVYRIYEEFTGLPNAQVIDCQTCIKIARRRK